MAFNAEYFKRNKESTETVLIEETKNKNDGILDDLFSNTNNKNKIKQSEIVDISIEQIEPYSNHIFKINENNLNELIESIKEYGVLNPIIVRIKSNNQYEILAGHHRHIAAKKIGLEKIPCKIIDVDDTQADIIVVNSNKQRGFADMLPSEIAYALKLEYEAVKSQGKRTDLIINLEEILLENDEIIQEKNAGLSSVGAENGTSDQVGRKFEYSNTNIKRYIRLTMLNKELLTLVDEEKIKFLTGVEISYLKNDNQILLLNCINETQKYPSLKQAEELKKLNNQNKITKEVIKNTLQGKIEEKKIKSITVPIKKISQYIDSSLSKKEVEEYIIKALRYYNEKQPSEN